MCAVASVSGCISNLPKEPVDVDEPLMFPATSKVAADAVRFKLPPTVKSPKLVTP